jgi:hypothetical protein
LRDEPELDVKSGLGLGGGRSPRLKSPAPPPLPITAFPLILPSWLSFGKPSALFPPDIEGLFDIDEGGNESPGGGGGRD